MQYILSIFLIALMTVFVGVLVKKFMHQISPQVVPDECKSWNRHRVMEKSLFLTGLILGSFIEAHQYMRHQQWMATNQSSQGQNLQQLQQSAPSATPMLTQKSVTSVVVPVVSAFMDKLN